MIKVYVGIFWEFKFISIASESFLYMVPCISLLRRQYYVFTNKATRSCKKFEVIFRYNSLPCKKIVNMFYIWMYNSRDVLRIII